MVQKRCIGGKSGDKRVWFSNECDLQDSRTSNICRAFETEDGKEAAGSTVNL